MKNKKKTIDSYKFRLGVSKNWGIGPTWVYSQTYKELVELQFFFFSLIGRGLNIFLKYGQQGPLKFRIMFTKYRNLCNFFKIKKVSYRKNLFFSILKRFISKFIYVFKQKFFLKKKKQNKKKDKFFTSFPKALALCALIKIVITQSISGFLINLFFCSTLSTKMFFIQRKIGLQKKFLEFKPFFLKYLLQKNKRKKFYKVMLKNKKNNYLIRTTKNRMVFFRSSKFLYKDKKYKWRYRTHLANQKKLIENANIFLKKYLKRKVKIKLNYLFKKKFNFQLFKKRYFLLRRAKKQLFLLFYIRNTLESLFLYFYKYRIVINFTNIWVNQKHNFLIYLTSQIYQGLMFHIYLNKYRINSRRQALFLHSFTAISFAYYFRNPTLMAQMIALRLPKTHNHMGFLKSLENWFSYLKYLAADNMGLRLFISGKINARTKTQNFSLIVGRTKAISRYTLQLSYGFAQAETSTGSFGIHLWLWQQPLHYQIYYSRKIRKWHYFKENFFGLLLK